MPIHARDVPFEPEYTEKQLTEAKNWLVFNKLSFSSTANFCIFGKAGVDSNLGRVCHRQISEPRVENRHLVATEIGWDRRHGFGAQPGWEDVSWEDFEPFLNWFLDKSLWGRFVVNREDKDFVKQYGIVVSADVFTPMMQQVMILSRHFLEVNVKSFRKFNELTANGFDPYVAYNTLFCTNISSVVAKMDYPVGNYPGHRALPLLTLKAMKALKAENLVYPHRYADKTGHYRNSSNYSGGAKIFFTAEDLSRLYPYGVSSTGRTFLSDLFADEEFRDALKSFRKKGMEGTAYKPPNPFSPKSRPVTAPNEVTIREYFDFVLPYCHDNGVFE